MESVKQILDLELYFHTKFNGCWYKITNDISGLNILFYQRCTDEMLKIFDSLYKKYFEQGYNVRKTDNIQTENEFRKECEETFSFYLSQHSYEMEYEKPTDCYLITKINNQRVYPTGPKMEICKYNENEDNFVFTHFFNSKPMFNKDDIKNKTISFENIYYDYNENTSIPIKISIQYMNMDDKLKQNLFDYTPKKIEKLYFNLPEYMKTHYSYLFNSYLLDFGDISNYNDEKIFKQIKSCTDFLNENCQLKLNEIKEKNEIMTKKMVDDYNYQFDNYNSRIYTINENFRKKYQDCVDKTEIKLNKQCNIKLNNCFSRLMMKFEEEKCQYINEIKRDYKEEYTKFKTKFLIISFFIFAVNFFIMTLVMQSRVFI